MTEGFDQFGDDGAQLGRDAMRRLRIRAVCAIDAGLTDAEFDTIEREFGFRFAEDHRAFLTAGLPVNTRPQPRQPGVIYTHPEPWPDWRRADRDKLRASLNRPIEGVLFDVEHNSFWHESWGTRPQATTAALATADVYGLRTW